MDLVSHRGITLILFGRPAIQLIWRSFVCTLSFDRLKYHLLKKCFLNLYEAVKSSGLVVQLKLKCLLMKPTHEYIIEAKEVYNQLSYEKYKGKLVLRN